MWQVNFLIAFNKLEDSHNVSNYDVLQTCFLSGDTVTVEMVDQPVLWR